MAYVAAADLKVLGYSWTDADTDNINLICEMASKAVDAYCKQTFEQATDCKEICIVRVKNGVAMLFPKNLTVSKITSITLEPFADITISGTFTGARWLAKQACIIAKASAEILNGDYVATLVYDYGYAADSIPADLKRATILTCMAYLDNYFLVQESNMGMLKTLKQGRITITRADMANATAVPALAMGILNGGNGGLGYVRARAAR